MVICNGDDRPPKTIVKPTALGPVANTDTKLLIYALFQKGRVLAQDAVGFTIVCPEGVIFSSMMTYHEQFLLLVVAGCVNRQQQDVIDYLQEENRVLRAGLRGKRLRLSDDDRRRLAVKAQALGREALAQIASVATPATLLRSDPNLNVSALIIFQTPSAPRPRNG